MARIGSFGDIIFEVSDDKILTFKDYNRKGSSRWNQYEIIGNKPKSDFDGPGLEEISISILLKVELGVNPSKQLEIIRNMKDTGKPALLILGNKPISPNYWVITDMEENDHIIDNRGNILKADVTLSLMEYFVPKKSEQKVTVSKTSSNASSSSKSIGKMTITVKSVHIRSGPGTSYKVLGYAFKGDTLTVYSEKNGWYYLGNGKYITASSKYSTFKKG